MKKILAIAIVLAMNTTVFAQFDDTSFRMDGINPELASIVQDEYTDWRANPADILSIAGHRFYSIVANLDGKGDTLAGGANDNFQFGYVGNPIIGILPNSQFGLLIHQGSSITLGNEEPGGFGDGNGGTPPNETKVSDTEITYVDDDDDGTLTSAGDDATTETRTGERYLETNHDVDSIDFGIGLTDMIDLGVRIERDIDTTEEPIKATWNRTVTEVGSTETNVENNSCNASEETTTNDMSLQVGTRIRLLDNLSIGGYIGYMPHSYEWERSSALSYYRDITAAAGDNPRRYTATGTDVGTILTTCSAATPAAFDFNDATTLLVNGFLWGEDLDANLGGLDNIPSGAAGKLEDEGNATIIGIDSYYDMTDDLTLYGALTMTNMPYDRKVNATDNASVSWTDDGGTNGTDVTSVVYTDSYTGSGDSETNEMGVILGAEQDLPGNVKIGYGIRYTVGDTDTNVTYTRSYSRYTTYDDTGDGLNVGDTEPAGDTSELVTRSGKWKEQDETETTTYEFPVGCELQPFKKLKLRVGATHTVEETVAKSCSKILEEGPVTTVDNDAGSAATTTIAYTGSNSVIGDDVVQTENTTKTRTTTYYYGAGYQWSENLSFDILGFGSDTGAGLLGIEGWNISATLMFGGGEEM